MSAATRDGVMFAISLLAAVVSPVPVCARG